MRVWGKILKGHRTMDQRTVRIGEAEGRNLVNRVKEALDEMVLDMDLPRPIWFKQNEEDLLKFGRTEFHQDHFIERIPFQKLELELIDEEDSPSNH